MSTLATIVWLRRRLAIHGLRNLAGAANLVAGIALATVAAVGALGFAAGIGVVVRMATLSGDPAANRLAWNTLFYTVAFFAIVVPIITGAGRGGFDPSRLLMFPVSRSGLHRLALCSEVVSSTNLVWYPAMATAAVVGIILAGPARPQQLAVLGLYSVLVVVWGHAVGILVRRLLRNRRLRELAAVVGLAAIVVLSITPAAVDITAENAEARIDELLTIPPWVSTATAVLPAPIATEALMALRAGKGIASGRWVGWLALWLAAGFAIGRLALDRSLSADAGSSPPAEAARAAPRGRTVGRLFDGLPRSIGAVAAKELRYLLQSGTGKLSLLMMPVMTALPALLTGRHGGMSVLGVDIEQLVFLGVMVYAAALTGYLQVNAFTWEKSGIATYFIAPVPLADVFFGKNLAVWLLDLVFVLEGILVWAAIRGFPRPSTLATALLIFGSTTMLTALLGNFTSIAVPVSRPISSLSSAASPVGTLVMIGCLLVGASTAALILAAANGIGAPGLEPLLSLAVFGSVAVAYKRSLRSAARVLSERRDDVFRALETG